jgi:hypothetical protein
MRRFAKFIAAITAMLVMAVPAFAADNASVSSEAGYVRVLFTLSPATSVQAEAEGSVLTISFGRKVAVTPQNIAAALPSLFASGRADPDGRTLRFALTQSVKLHTSTVGMRSVVDLAPLNFAGIMPDLPPPAPSAPATVDADHLPVLKVRSGSYPAFTRLVFDWTRQVPYSVFPGSGKIGVRFEAQARPDLSAITRSSPPWVKNAGWRVDGKVTVVEFDIDSGSGYHDFRDGNKIVLDILSPKTEATAYMPPGDAKPAPTMLPQTAKSATTGITSAQAKEIADTAAKLAAKNAPPVKAEPAKAEAAKSEAAKAEHAPLVEKAAATETGPAEAKKAATEQAAEVQTADGKVIKDGVVLTFKGAGTRGSAVFIRGLSAWIVLQGGTNLDATALKNSLGSFPAGIDAASGNGVATLRITLKQPAQIAARAIGADLKVVIASSLNDQPIAIGFARNQDDPKRASLTTVLPGAERTIPLLDPVTGDVLTVIPAAAGRAMLAPRSFVEFTALATASGLVLTPHVDDLEVKVAPARVTITRPGGLYLTPPQMPVAETPAILAQRGEGASFLPLAKWSEETGGSFLATQRRLRQLAATARPETISQARLALARFYLGNGFAADALGLINLIQETDPALQGDRHLTTMRAAADYMMGRYNAAHNELAGSAFDADRHAAFWRGLIEAALENWPAAHAAISQAQPVMRKYPLEWQARAHIADADAALGIGRLELADAALARIPRDLPKQQMLAAELVRARILSAENRYKASATLFDGIIAVNEPRTSAEAIFHKTNAALRAGAISTKMAIAELEKLRYRWRGDALEMATLRKLASLYFAQGNWRNGLRTLRVANESFPNADLARQAQDDMRQAFVDLYLKGKADKLKPVDALALFYDFIDLTPIGPEGDDMIRRMADRLAAVDLLGSAADLLKHQIDNRLEGVARAQVAVRLAMIQLSDHKPQDALDTLRSTRITGLPEQVNHDRMLLEARALAALKKWDEAIDLLAVDEAPDTRSLRADIYWESGNWAQAGQTAEALLTERAAAPEALTAEERKLVLRTAISYSLANDEASLERLKSLFAGKMKNSPDSSAFAVVTEHIDAQGTEFRDAAAKIASIDTLESFMKDMKARNTTLASN